MNPLPGEYNQNGQRIGSPGLQTGSLAAPGGSTTPNLDRFLATNAQAPSAMWSMPTAAQNKEVAFARNGRDTDADAATRAAAGTGQTVQTRYGTASSTMAPKGQTLTDAVTGPNGVSRLSWQQQVVKNHPEIGQEGTAANQEFVRAYKASQAGGPGMESDPVKIAENVYNRQAPSMTAPGGALYQSPVANADIKAPAPIGGPTQPVMFAGSDVSGSQAWSPIKTPATGYAAAGQNIRTGIGDTARAGAGSFDRNIVAPLVNSGRAVANFWGGLTGGNTSRPAYTPTPEAAPAKMPTANPADGPVRLPSYAWSTPSSGGAPDAFAQKPLEMGADLMGRPRKPATSLWGNVAQGY